ncbi:MAG: class I SAM-dependent methyltransferase, partial [Rhodospirillales bacterium]
MLEKDMTCGKDTRLVSDKTAWHQYYSEKRIIHQWMQVHLLQNLPVSRILEIGPHLGLVTAMLCNAGYGVSILDIAKRFDFPNVDCITEDIRNISPEQLLGFDAVLCCEVLEHIPFDDVPNIVLKFSNVRYLIISVPYMANQLTFNLYINAYTFKKYTSIKKLLNFRKFK